MNGRFVVTVVGMTPQDAARLGIDCISAHFPFAPTAAR